MDSRRRLTTCITLSLVLVIPGSVEAKPFSPSGKGGQVSGKATVSVRKLGRDRSILTSELRIGPSALSADAPGGFRVAGPYAQSGSGGRTLSVTHDPGSESSLLSFLAGRVAALYARRRNDQASFGVTVLSRRTRARANGHVEECRARLGAWLEYRAGAEVSFELEAETTAGGVLVGGSVGGSVDAGISWGSSSATAYSGTVGSLPAASFAENQYSFGLFTCLFNAGEKTKPQFEVVHYWVE